MTRKDQDPGYMGYGFPIMTLDKYVFEILEVIRAGSSMPSQQPWLDIVHVGTCMLQRWSGLKRLDPGH